MDNRGHSSVEQDEELLRAASIETVADLTQYSLGELRSFRNMGAKSMKEIEEFIAELGCISDYKKKFVY